MAYLNNKSTIDSYKILTLIENDQLRIVVHRERELSAQSGWFILHNLLPSHRSDQLIRAYWELIVTSGEAIAEQMAGRQSSDAGPKEKASAKQVVESIDAHVKVAAE